MTRSSSVDATQQTVDPVTFDQVEINQGSLYASNGLVTVSQTGYYYVYISTSVDSGSVGIVIL